MGTHQPSIMLLILGLGLLGSYAIAIWLAVRTRRAIRTYHPRPRGTRNLEARVTLTEQQLQLFWRIVNRKLASLLHAPTHEVMDRLLQKLTNDVLSPEEAVALHRMLQEHRQDLAIEGKTEADLTMPTLLVLWALEVRILQAGLDVPPAPQLGHYSGPTPP